ncbi:MAG TPA: MCP four helix bundle domain-containing protein, partial [Pseudobdellovibrionaceae bacterium]|nr:MCP four helix bundle domain-containing protein [Pseudobdellovibrionaceae bacterium]
MPQLLKNLSLANKIWALCLFLIASLAVLGFSSLAIVSKLNSQLSILTEVELPAVRTMTLLDMYHDGLRAIVFRSELASNQGVPAEIEDVKKEFLEMSANMNKSLKELAEINLDPQSKESVEASSQDIRDYITFADNLIREQFANKNSPELGKLRKTFSNQFKKLEVGLDKTGDFIETKANEEKAKSNQLASFSLNMTLVGLLAILALSLIATTLA